MQSDLKPIEDHYARGGILQSILAALEKSGKDTNQLEPADLAPVDEFHIRGREATLELAERAKLKPGLRVLDVGCGLGGSARYLATEQRCQVVGIDLTHEYIDTANKLAGLVGLDHQVEFHHGSALKLPFPDNSFDLVWTEHAQMNIADKKTFYAEIARVLKPGGRFVFHDIFAGDQDPPHFPVPWAEIDSLSFLTKSDQVRNLLPDLGLQVVQWDDKTQHSFDWLKATMEKFAQTGPPPLGIHLLMGATAKQKLGNVARNFEENRIQVIQAVAEKN
ncbi:MAG: methyltransferase domain-containing protein [Candidatus Zixiibacteriota bacterium]